MAALGVGSGCRQQEGAETSPSSLRGAGEAAPEGGREVVAEGEGEGEGGRGGPEARRCGEAGATPTELPAAVARGRERVGEGVVRPREDLSLGTVKVRYEPHAWIGTHKAGFRAPALQVEIDRAEAGGGPWGGQEEVRAGQALQLFVGPYRVDARAGEGDPPGEVRVSAVRATCPESAQTMRSAEARWIWVSTEAIRLYSYDLEGELLQVAIGAQGAAPRMDVATLRFRDWFEPRPGESRRIYTGRHVVTIDAVTPGEGTRFEGAWAAADGLARAHARAMIAPAPAPALAVADAVAPSGACGEVGAARTTLPPALGRPLAVTEGRTIDRGARGRLGPLELDYGTLTIPAYGGGPYREPARDVPFLTVTGQGGGTTVTGPVSSPRIVRVGESILRVSGAEAGAVDRLMVERIALGCPAERTIGALGDGVYAWLGGQGPRLLQAGDGAYLQLYDGDAPALSFGGASAFYTADVTPGIVGEVVTIDGVDVAIVDVVASDGTSWAEGRWGTPGALVGVNVQVRVSRAG